MERNTFLRTAIIAIPLALALILGIFCISTPTALGLQAGARQTSGGTGREECRRPPEDFALTFSQGPAHADWGGAVRFTLSADGSYSVERQARRGGGPGSWETKARGTLSRQDMAKIYRAVDEHGFWDLQRHYRDPGIIDGTVTSLRVASGGRAQRVVLSNINIPQITAILAVVRQALPKNHRYF